jgi:peptidoglycan/LPS O-acetylase OafA/YrhL
MKRTHELDGLRAIAALMVVAWHYIGRARFLALVHILSRSLPRSLRRRPVFVLSGFLITTILLENRESNTYFSSFHGRRALRIWPVYYLMCATCLVGWLSGKSLALFEGVVPCWTYVLGVQNFWMAKLQDFGAFWLAGTST